MTIPFQIFFAAERSLAAIFSALELLPNCGLLLLDLLLNHGLEAADLLPGQIEALLCRTAVGIAGTCIQRAVIDGGRAPRIGERCFGIGGGYLQRVLIGPLNRREVLDRAVRPAFVASRRSMR